MYTKTELKAAADMIKQIANAHHMSEAQVRADMKAAMDIGRSNPDPAVKARWAAFYYAGAEPTLEEFIVWAASMIMKNDGC